MVIRREKVKIADTLVNLTKVRVCVYDDNTGEIECFGSLCGLHGVAVAARNKNPYYVVDNMGDALELCRFLDVANVAVITHKSVGRDGYNISNLVWAKEPEQRVLLRCSSSQIIQ